METDLDLRKLRYFLVVAQRLSFRRAAEELHIAQPVLSRQIRALEDELSIRLFDRGPKGTDLTPAGTQLLHDAVPLLRQAESARRRALRGAKPERCINVGAMPGLLATSAVSAFKLTHPKVRVEMRVTNWANQIALIRDGTLDISLAREPFEEADLHVSRVTTEVRLALLHRASPLAQKAAVSVADLATMLLLQDPELFPEWLDATTDELRKQTIAMAYPTTVEAKLEQVASGAGFVILPQSTASFYQRPDVRPVFVTDIPPASVSLVLSSDADPLVADLAQAIKDLGDTVVAYEGL